MMVLISIKETMKWKWNERKWNNTYNTKSKTKQIKPHQYISTFRWQGDHQKGQRRLHFHDGPLLRSIFTSLGLFGCKHSEIAPKGSSPNLILLGVFLFQFGFGIESPLQKKIIRITLIKTQRSSLPIDL